MAILWALSDFFSFMTTRFKSLNVWLQMQECYPAPFSLSREVWMSNSAFVLLDWGGKQKDKILERSSPFPWLCTLYTPHPHPTFPHESHRTPSHTHTHTIIASADITLLKSMMKIHIWKCQLLQQQDEVVLRPRPDGDPALIHAHTHPDYRHIWPRQEITVQEKYRIPSAAFTDHHDNNLQWWRIGYRGAWRLIGELCEGPGVADWFKGSTVTTRSLYSFNLLKCFNCSLEKRLWCGTPARSLRPRPPQVVSRRLGLQKVRFCRAITHGRISSGCFSLVVRNKSNMD